QHFTEPPPRYTDSTLIRDLEEKGIGRPSTYAMILSNIQDREYVRKRKGKGKLHPTELGLTVNMLLSESFPDIINERFTAELESRLDSVADGSLPWLGVLEKFYQEFEGQLSVAKTSMRNIKREGVPTEYTCDKCESPMVLKWGRNGQFLACSAFPECRNTMNVEQDEEGKISPVSREVATDEKCDKCESPMVIKHGRYGKFMACSGFPECKNTRPLGASPAKPGDEPPIDPDEELPPCPKCGSDTVRRRGRYGTFIACSAYPKCKTIVRAKGDAGPGGGKGKGKGKGKGRRKSTEA
ncbi:MAG: topoisomerase DNA-binding C4 zinc finger domain-containing protein, partial [Myxococcota bacterium]|nr:topoisomerase DNA-binding C4 zinc finger domain-containing protein [Myxococcota bacterium]